MEYAEVDASIVDHAKARLGLRVGAARKQEENGTVSKQQHRRAPDVESTVRRGGSADDLLWQLYSNTEVFSHTNFFYNLRRLKIGQRGNL